MKQFRFHFNVPYIGQTGIYPACTILPLYMYMCIILITYVAHLTQK